MAKSKIAQRKDGRYSRQIYLGRDESGKRKYKTVYGKTQKEVNEKYNENRRLLNKGIDLSAMNDSFKDWKNEFLAIKKASSSFRYFQDIESKCRHLSSLDDMEISKIRPTHIQTILIELANRAQNPLSRKTIKDIFNVARGIFRLAINNRVMDFNPCDAVVIPSTKPMNKREALTDEQISWILNTEHRAQLPAMIMLYSGVRRGELIALTWSDIDFKNKTINVNKSCEFYNNKPHIKPFTKTAAGMRIINIPDILVDFLKQQTHDSLLVCPYNNSYYTEGAFRRMWENYMQILNEKYGNFSAVTMAKKKDGTIKSRFAPGGLPTVIDTFTPHQLRHTFASMLYKSGVDVLTAKELLGHADVKTTLNIYTHLDSRYKMKTIDKLNDYIVNQNNIIEKDS